MSCIGVKITLAALLRVFIHMFSTRGMGEVHKRCVFGSRIIFKGRNIFYRKDGGLWGAHEDKFKS